MSVLSYPRDQYPKGGQGAFSLVEIMIALGIASFCLVAMLGLLPSGLKSAKNTTDQTAAATLLSNIALDLRTTQMGNNISPLLGIKLPATNSIGITNSSNFFFNEDGTMTNTNTALSVRYGVLLTQANPTPLTTTAQIQIYWPPSVPTNSLRNALGIIESVITINRQ